MRHDSRLHRRLADERGVALIIALMATSDTGAAWVQALVAVTVTLTVVSGVRYLLAWRRVAVPAGVRAA